MKKVVYFALLILLAFPAIVFADDLIQEGALLTLDQCIAVALKMQPDILAAKSAADVNRRKIGVSRAASFLQIEASGGYGRTSPVSGGSGVGGSTNTFDTYRGSLAFKQDIYAFGKNAAQVGVQRLNLDVSLSDVAAGSVRQYELHLKQAKGSCEVGTKSKFDVTKAEVDLCTARLNLIKAENAVKTAVAKLNNAMGVPEAPGYAIEDTLSYFSVFSTKSQVEEAKANLNASKTNEVSLRQTVVLELQQSYLSLKEAEEKIPVAELTEMACIQALYDYKIATVKLEKAMGEK